MDNKTQSEALGRAIIFLKQGWTFGALARDSLNRRINVISPEAKFFCVMGALYKAFHEMKLIDLDKDFSTAFSTQFTTLQGKIKTTNNIKENNLAVWNDESSAEPVIQALTKTKEEIDKLIGISF